MNFLYDILGVPFGFVLNLIYKLVSNYGVAIILFTLFARLLMVPTTISQQKGSAKTQRLQPKIRRINERYAGDQRKIQEETQALYQREGYNPMSAGCLPLLIQMPIIFGLIAVMYNPLQYALNLPDGVITSLTDMVKAFMGDSYNDAQQKRYVQMLVIEKLPGIKDQILANPSLAKYYNEIASFDFVFLGIPLGQIPQFKVFDRLWAIPILSGVSSLASGIFTQIKQKQQNPQMAKNPTMGCMTYTMPLISVYFTFQFPAAIGIYWIASNIFSFITTIILNFTHNPKKTISKIMVEETIYRRSKENNIKTAVQIKNAANKNN